jgi:uncharacterized OB-fold protein
VTFVIPVCAECATAVFPPRVICPKCGNREWRAEVVADGVIERTTERDATRIASVRTQIGPVLIVRLLDQAGRGDGVLIDADSEIPVATRRRL